MSIVDGYVFPSTGAVAWALTTYTDWWQPVSGSVIEVGSSRRARRSDWVPAGLLDAIAPRTELCRRMETLPQRERRVLFLWYVEQLPVEDVARSVGVSRRHCFRLRAEALRKLVDEDPTRAA